ncbi:MAG: hypothetical protein SangKO_049270 [Sandaracinaceae bacterium]
MAEYDGHAPEREPAVFPRVTGTRRTEFVTLVTTCGVGNDAHAQRLGLTTVAMGAFFESPPRESFAAPTAPTGAV